MSKELKLYLIDLIKNSIIYIESNNGKDKTQILKKLHLAYNFLQEGIPT